MEVPQPTLTIPNMQPTGDVYQLDMLIQQKKLEQVKAEPIQAKNHGKTWILSEETTLLEGIAKGQSLSALADVLERSKGSIPLRCEGIAARLKKAGGLSDADIMRRTGLTEAQYAHAMTIPDDKIPPIPPVNAPEKKQGKYAKKLGLTAVPKKAAANTALEDDVRQLVQVVMKMSTQLDQCEAELKFLREKLNTA